MSRDRNKEEVRTMLVTALQEERQKIYQQGEVAGEAAGVLKGQRQTLLLLLQHRYQLNETEQANLAQQLDKITEAESLTALTNHGLQEATFEGFNTHLLKYLPIENNT